MDNYNFYADEKIVTWRRYYLSVEANSNKEAIKMIEGYTKQYGINKTIDKYCCDSETLTDWERTMSLAENGWQPTIEILDDDGNEIINNKDVE